MLKKVFYNTFFQIVAKAFTASTTLLISILIGKSLGPAGYGEFTKIFVFVGYFYTAADFGLNTAFIKIADDKSQIKLLKTLVALRLLIAVLLSIIAASFTLVLPYDPSLSTGFSPLVKVGILIASATIVTQALFTSANAFFQKNLRYDLSAISAVVGYALILILAFIFSRAAVSPIPYVFAYVFGGVTFVLIAFYLIYSKSKKLPLPRLNIEIAKKFFPAWPVGVALILNLVYFRIDVFILSNYRSSAEVGYYGLAYQFFEASLAIPIFFANSIFPLLSDLYKQNLNLFKAELRRWLILLAAASLGLVILLFAASYLIPLIFDARFIPSQIALRILALGLPLFFISALLWHVLIIYGKQKYLIFIYATGAIFNLIANLALIPSYGYLAAAITTVASEALILALLIFFSVRIGASES